jgi:hypothetical protein
MGKYIGKVLRFENSDSRGLWFATLFIYSSFIFYLLSLFTIPLYYKLKSSSFDSLFLLFSFIPFISSIFCFFAQFIYSDNNQDSNL